MDSFNDTSPIWLTQLHLDKSKSVCMSNTKSFSLGLVLFGVWPARFV